MTEVCRPARRSLGVGVRWRSNDDLSLFQRVQEILAFRPETVFLQAAVGFFGNGAFDEAGCQGGVKVVGAEGGTVGKLELGHGLQCAARAGFECAEEPCDLIGDLVADLVGFSCFAKRGEQDGEKEFYKRGGVADLVTSAEHLVVLRLLFADDGLYRKEGKERVPAAENEGLPEAADAAVAIGKGVDEFEFVVKDAAGDERVRIGVFEPEQEVLHEAGDLGCGGCEVHDFCTLGNADRSGSETARVIDESRREQAVGGEQVLELVRIPGVHGLVGCEGIFDFLNIRGRAEDAFTLDDCSDLLQAEGIIFDGEGCVDRFDAVLPAEQRNFALPGERTEPSDFASDLRNEGEDRLGDGIRRRIGERHFLRMKGEGSPFAKASEDKWEMKDEG